MIDPNPEELPNTLTPVAPADVYDALSRAWERYFGTRAPHRPILVLMAQSALETGRWKQIHCWNFGNAKSSPGDGRCWCFYRCNELIDGKWVWFDPPNPQTRFRAFRCIEDGALDYLGMLVKSFAPAWPAVMAGDAWNFCTTLKACGYYTAELEPYRHSVCSIFREYLQSIPEPERDPLTQEEHERIANLVAMTMRENIEI